MKLLNYVLISCLSIAVFSHVQADGGGGYDDDSNSQYSHLHDDFESAIESIEDGNFSMAIKYLEQLQIRRSSDADVFNLLGYSHRKLKDYTLAESYYNKALEIEPKHKGANEYLGELYLETDRLELAEQRLEVLKNASLFRNQQYKNLKQAIGAYKEN